MINTLIGWTFALVIPYFLIGQTVDHIMEWKALLYFGLTLASAVFGISMVLVEESFKEARKRIEEKERCQ